MPRGALTPLYPGSTRHGGPGLRDLSLRGGVLLPVRALLVILTALLVGPASASAAFGPPVSIPATGGEAPRALAFADGRGVLVTQAGGEPYSQATQHTIAIPGGRRQTFADTSILDSVARQDGGVDLLVRRTSDPLKRADITLRRVLPSGKVYDLWSVRTRATRGALARGKGRTFVAWPEGSALKLITRPDGGIPSRPHNARIGVAGVVDLDLAVDGRGRLVAAVATAGAGTVVASLRSTGTVLQRERRRDAGGLVEIAVTRGGRVGVLVEDTGIEGDYGECVSDGAGRHIRVLVRERGEPRFGSARAVESPRFGCGPGGALLRALPADALVVVYQGGSYDFPPLLARASTAPRGEPFAAPATIATDARADTAVVTRDGELVIGLLRKTTAPELFEGALSTLRGSSPEEPVAAGPASSPLLARDRAGRAVLAWRAGATLQVAVDQP